MVIGQDEWGLDRCCCDDLVQDCNTDADCGKSNNPWSSFECMTDADCAGFGVSTASPCCKMLLDSTVPWICDGTTQAKVEEVSLHAMFHQVTEDVLVR
jgi:hypothetical protein